MLKSVERAIWTCVLVGITTLASAQNQVDAQRQYQDQQRERQEREREEQRKRDAERDHDLLMQQMERDRERNRQTPQAQGGGSGANVGGLLLGAIFIAAAVEMMSNPSQRRSPRRQIQQDAWERDPISTGCVGRIGAKAFTRSGTTFPKLYGVCLCLAETARKSLTPSEVAHLANSQWSKVQPSRLAAVASSCGDTTAEQADLIRLVDATMPPVESVGPASEVSLYVHNTCKSTMVLHTLSNQKVWGLVLDPGRRMPFFATSKPASDGTFMLAWKAASSGQEPLDAFDSGYSAKDGSTEPSSFLANARRVKAQQVAQDEYEVSLVCR